MKQKMYLEAHYPQNTISHSIISNKLRSHCTFSGSNSAIPEIRADLLLAISKTEKCLLALSFFNVLLFWFPACQGLKTVNFSTF